MDFNLSSGGSFASLFTRNRLIRWGIILASLIVVVAFLPRENKFGYDYELGKPWKYGSIIAAYDFPIYKSDARLRSERDSAKKLFRPYFSYNHLAEGRALRLLHEDFANGNIKDVPANYEQHLARMLHLVYGIGILGGEQLVQLSDSNVTDIQILVGQEASTHSVDSLLSTRRAYELILAADTLNFPPAILKRCNLNNYINPNLVYDATRNNAMKQNLLSTVAPASGMVQTGQRIVDRGDIVDAYTYNILTSLEKESSRRNDPTQGLWKILAGQIFFAVTLFALFITYFILYRKDCYARISTMALVFSLVAIFSGITGAMVSHKFFSIYLIPYALVPIFVRVFIDTRTAFLTHVVTILLASLSLHSPYQFILMQIVGGLAAIFSLREITQRSQLVRVAGVITAVTMLFSLSYDFSQGFDLKNLDHHSYLYMLISGVLLLFAYPLMYLIERLFGFTSNITLIELSNTNTPLLRKMSKDAQGTFIHSMQVANLAGEVANVVGANVQLVRTGALYHDIGKMLKPAFFTENQLGTNPHDELTEEQSAEIIISHVTDGMKMAEKHHIPQIVRDFIVTHHGRNKVKYFYIQYCNKHPAEKVDEQLFTYPGPNPSTLEQAILMMADAIEASSRSLKQVDEESLRELVNRIVDTQMNDGCFDKCPITFGMIDKAKNVFVESLKTIYHTRIPYPELKNKPQTAEATQQPTDGIGKFFNSKS